MEWKRKWQIYSKRVRIRRDKIKEDKVGRLQLRERVMGRQKGKRGRKVWERVNIKKKKSESVI